MSEPPRQERDLERVIEVDEVAFECEEGSRVLCGCRIRVTTPEQEPALVTLRLEVLLQSLPTTTIDGLGEWLLRLAADRLREMPPEPDAPGPA